jgi:WD40 repeat protein
MGHVFISYSRADRDYVERLASHLESEKIDVWLDFEIGSGQRWAEVLRQKIEECDVMIVVMSPAAERSDMVEVEIDLARSRHKPIMPLLLGGDEPLFLLRNKHFDDVRGGLLPPPQFVSRLRALRSAPESTPSVPGAKPAAPAPPRVAVAPIEPELVQTLAEPVRFVGAVAFTSDGTQVLAASNGRESVRFWDVATGEIRRSLLGHENGVGDLALSPDGRQFATCSLDKTIRVWDTASGETLRTLVQQQSPTALAWSPKGTHLLVGDMDGDARVWGVATRLVSRTLAGHTTMVGGVAWSPADTQLATAGADSTVRIWDAATGAPQQILTGHHGQVRSVAFSPDGSHLATGSWDGTAAIWDTGTWATVPLPTRGHVLCLAFSPDGTRLAMGFAEGALLVEIATLRETFLPATGRERQVISTAFSADGTLLAACAAQHLLVWRVAAPR